LRLDNLGHGTDECVRPYMSCVATDGRGSNGCVTDAGAKDFVSGNSNLDSNVAKAAEKFKIHTLARKRDKGGAPRHSIAEITKLPNYKISQLTGMF
jgi:hypothetical protein